MPVDMQKLMLEKEKIISTVQSRGPSLPVQIAREANLNLLFASAYLSELYNENKIKMSHMKVGSSSLYFLRGQEAMLENFIQYLNAKEKEAFSLLKTEKILEDEKLEPAIRVALRSLKDFAIPIKIKFENDSKLFWKFFLISDDETKVLAQSYLNIVEKKPHKKKEEKQENKEKDKQETLNEKSDTSVEPQKTPHKTKKVKEQTIQQDTIEELKQKLDELSQNLKKTDSIEQTKPTETKQKKTKQIEESQFIKNLKEHLTSKDIELLETKEFSKKDLLGKVRIDTLFGKQEYLLIAKEKKKITEEDLTLALHKAQLEKMPALFISPGDIDKKAEDHAKTWKNLVKFEKVKF